MRSPVFESYLTMNGFDSGNAIPGIDPYQLILYSF